MYRYLLHSDNCLWVSRSRVRWEGWGVDLMQLEPKPPSTLLPHTPHLMYTQRLVPASAQPADVSAIMRALALTNHAGAGPLVQACLLHALRCCDANFSIRPRHYSEGEERLVLGSRSHGGSGGGGGGGGYSAAQLAEVMSSLAELQAAQGGALQMEELNLLDDAVRRRWRLQQQAVQGGSGGGGSTTRSGSNVALSVLPRVVQQLLGHLSTMLVERPLEFRWVLLAQDGIAPLTLMLVVR